MIKRIGFFILLVIDSQLGKSQFNLVSNPSFELYDTCPDNLGQIKRAIGWLTAKNTPDYFNVCSTDTLPSGQYIASVPSNGFGYRNASGNAYAGIIASISGSGSREFISAQLITPFQVGIKYFVSFKVSLAGQANPTNRCGINKLGILFSTVQYSDQFNAPICNCSQIVSDSIITDTLNWTKIMGSFIADSVYSFISIGRFANDSSTNSIQLIGTQCIAYYYIEDVCISDDSVYAYNYTYTGLIENKKDESLIYFPNPANDFVTIKDYTNDILGLRIFTSQGQLIQSFSIDNLKSYTADIRNMPKGLYYLSLLRKNKSPTTKILIKH